jgi:RNA polymerase sigma-70 factor (ECF subfamily)
MHRVALTFVRSSAVADEVVQEAWLGALRGLDRFEGRSALKTWLLRIVANIARTHAVREARTVPFSSLELAREAAEHEPALPTDRFQGPDERHPCAGSRSRCPGRPSRTALSSPPRHAS